MKITWDGIEVDIKDIERFESVHDMRTGKYSFRIILNNGDSPIDLPAKTDDPLAAKRYVNMANISIKNTLEEGAVCITST